MSICNTQGAMHGLRASLAFIGTVVAIGMGINLFGERLWPSQQRGEHPHAVIHKFFIDHTPSIDFYCPDCEMRDRGHVYADPATWLDEP